MHAGSTAGHHDSGTPPHAAACDHHHRQDADRCSSQRQGALASATRDGDRRSDVPDNPCEEHQCKWVASETDSLTTEVGLPDLDTWTRPSGQLASYEVDRGSLTFRVSSFVQRPLPVRAHLAKNVLLI